MSNKLHSYSMRECARQLTSKGVDISKSDLHRKLKKLEESGVVILKRFPGKRCFYQFSDSDVDAIASYLTANTDQPTPLTDSLICAEDGFFGGISAFRQIEQRMRAAEALLEECLMVIPFGQFHELDGKVRAHLTAAKAMDGGANDQHEVPK